MKILHTSDWHLGKRLFKLDRTPEHELFLEWLIGTLKSEEIDLLLIAGDIFDTPMPPHQALEMFYNFLHRVSTETKTETMIIAGNHDSGILLEAPAKILAPHRVKVWGKLSPNLEDHWIKFKTFELCAIPYFRSYELLPQGEGDAIETLKKYLIKEKELPQVLMLHHLAGVFEAAGSEQVISLSGVDSIPTEILSTFDYVALGHIHKPQKVGPAIFYSGSPIPLRFSETKSKSVVIIEEKEGALESRLLPIPVFRNLFIVKTNEASYLEDLDKIAKTTDLAPMVEIQIELPSPKVGLIDEIKEKLAKKEMELLSFIPHYQGEDRQERKSEKIFKLSTLELFEEFYATKYPQDPQIPDDLKDDFKHLLEKVKHATSSS